MYKIGYNVHSDDNGLLEHLKKVKPPVVLVLENYGLAHDIAVELPNTQVIYRPYFPESDAYHLIMRPNEFVARMAQKWQGEPNIWFHTGNESGLSIEQQEWEMALSASPAGMKFVVGNPATGSFPDSIEAWKYADKYIRFLVANKDRFWLGLHEYFDGIPCITMPGFRNRVFNWNDGGNRPGWQTNRYRWLIDYCDSVGIGYPNIVLTECGNDDLRENRDNSDVNAFIDSMRCNAGYYNIRGWKTLQDQWQDWYQKPADVTYYEMLEWLENNVYNHSSIKGMCIFAWCSSQSSWDQFNVAYADEFRKKMEARVDYIPSVEIFCEATSTFNLRSSPSTTSKVVVLIKPLTPIYISVTGVKVGSYMWYPVSTGDGYNGYVRSDVLRYVVYRKSISAYGVRVRSTPVTGTVLTMLKPNGLFTFTGNKQGVWAEVTCNGVVGWVSTEVLTYQ